MDDKTLKHWASGPLCTITQAAALLGVSSQTVRRMVMHGSLIAWRPNPAGRKWMLYRRQVEAMAVTLQRRAIRCLLYTSCRAWPGCVPDICSGRRRC